MSLRPDRVVELLEQIATALASRTPDRFTGASLANPKAFKFRLSDLPAYTDGNGVRVLVPTGARVLRLSMQSHASARLEVALERRPANTASPTDPTTGPELATEWLPIVPGGRISAPGGAGGATFSEFRVRRAYNTPSNTNLAIFTVDSDNDAAELGRFAQVSDSGGLSATMNVIRASDGVMADAEGADGTAATRAAVGVAGWNPGSSTYQRLTSGIGDATTGSLRVIEATTPTATVARVTAGAASSAALAANANRRAFQILNMDTAENVYINFGGTAAATATGHRIGPGQTYSGTTREAVNVIRGGAADVSVSVVEEVAA